MELTFLSHSTVELIDFMGGDGRVAQAARVSTVGGDAVEDAAAMGLINYLVSNKHGSPLEHSVFTFYIESPIFVIREFQRHRIASYSETSARYRKLEPRFYVPPRHRKLVNEGGSARPEFVPGNSDQRVSVDEGLRRSYETAWAEYETMINQGVANEVARSVLPVGVFSQMLVTLNARSLTNFLSLRVDSAESAVRSRPQAEIQEVADEMERIFKDRMPLTHSAFVSSGRVPV